MRLPKSVRVSGRVSGSKTMQERKRPTRQQLAHTMIFLVVISLILIGIFTLHTPTPKAQAKLVVSQPDETRNFIALKPATTTTTVKVVATTVPLPAVVATKPPQAVQQDSSCSLVNQYGWPVEVAYGVCQAESQGNTNAHNTTDNHGSCMGSFGLMQLGCFWFPFYGQQVSFDPAVNIDLAYKVWLRSGGSFRQWSTCKIVNGCS